ncbi:MAG: YbaB/EbfC family nucleoid-associated protein [Planctomycetota bacterium]
MNGTPGDMGNLLAQAQRMQRALDDARAELRALVVEGNAGGNAARAFVTGEGVLLRVEISDDAFRQSDRKLMEELVAGAVRDAQERANRRSSERLAEVTGGLQLPGFM